MSDTKSKPNNKTLSFKSNKADLKASMSPLPSVENEPAKPLTPKEKAVLQFIEEYISGFGFSPSYQEIKEHFQLASFNSVQNYLKQLTQKNYILNPLNQKRAIQVLKSSNSYSDYVEKVSTMGSPRTPLLQSTEEILSLPLLGKVAAGLPIESLKFDEHIEVPSSLVKKSRNAFALQVQGDSMIEEGILDGDFLIIDKTSSAIQGEIIVATVDSEATVKRIYTHAKKAPQSIELRPSNSRLKSQWYSPDQVEIKGKVIALFRKY